MRGRRGNTGGVSRERVALIYLHCFLRLSDLTLFLSLLYQQRQRNGQRKKRRKTNQSNAREGNSTLAAAAAEARNLRCRASERGGGWRVGWLAAERRGQQPYFGARAGWVKITRRAIRRLYGLCLEPDLFSPARTSDRRFILERAALNRHFCSREA